MLIALRPRLPIVCAVLSLGSSLPIALGQPDAVRDSPDNPSPPGALVRIKTMGPIVYGGVSAIVFSTDGKLLASSNTNRMHLWQTATGKEVVIPSHTSSQGGYALALSPDGKTIAIALTGGVLFSQFPSCEVQATLRWSGGAVNSLAFSPDGKRLVTGDDEHSVRVWDVAERKELIRLDGHKGLVSAVAFAPDGKHIASASLDQTFRLWDAASGKEVRRFEGHRDQIWCLRFAPDGKTIASASMDHTVRLWDVATGKEVRCCRGHRFGVFSLDFAPDGRTLVSAGLDGTLRFWETATGKELRRVNVTQGGLRAVAFAPDGKSVASGDGHDNVRLWNASTGKMLRAIGNEPVGRSGSLRSINWSPDGHMLVTASGDGTVRLWDAATGKERRELGRQSDDVWSAAFNPDGKTVVSVGRREGTVHVWDVRSGEELYPFPSRHLGGVSRVAFDRQGKRLATGGGSFDPTIHIWDPVKGNHVRGLTGHTDYVDSIALSGDGRLLASASRDGTLRLWDVETGKGRLLKNGGGRGDPCVALSPDGRLLAASGAAGFRLWDTATGRNIRTLGDGINLPASLAFSPDGRILAAGLFTNTVCLWDMMSGQTLVRFSGHRQTARSVAFSPKGRRLASAGSDGVGLVWDVTGLHGKKLDRPGEPELDDLWKALAGEDATAANRAVWRLSAAPDEAVPFLAARLRPVKSIATDRIADWIKELDDDRFAVRERASRELARLGDAAEPALRQLVAEPPSLEARRRAEALLQALDEQRMPPERLRELRAIQALEYADTSAARKTLETLTKGASAARLTREAKSALGRLEKRRTVKP